MNWENRRSHVPSAGRPIAMRSEIPGLRSGVMLSLCPNSDGHQHEWIYRVLRTTVDTNNGNNPHNIGSRQGIFQCSFCHTLVAGSLVLLSGPTSLRDDPEVERIDDDSYSNELIDMDGCAVDAKVVLHFANHGTYLQ